MNFIFDFSLSHLPVKLAHFYDILLPSFKFVFYLYSNIIHILLQLIKYRLLERHWMQTKEASYEISNACSNNLSYHLFRHLYS